MIENGEFQKAYSFLQRRLKPLEATHSSPSEFSALCYLLSCKSVSDSDFFKNWQGITISRNRLSNEIISIVSVEALTSKASSIMINPDSLGFSNFNSLKDPLSSLNNTRPRLISLLKQAVAHQIRCATYQSTSAPKIHTLVCYLPTNALILAERL